MTGRSISSPGPSDPAFPYGLRPHSERVLMPIPKISPEFDVRHLVKAGIDQRGRRVGAFETLNEAKKESRHRFRLLCQDDTDDEALILAQMLLACEKRARCESLACPVCVRLRRIQWSAAVLKFLAAYDLEDL